MIYRSSLFKRENTSVTFCIRQRKYKAVGLDTLKDFG